MKITRIGADSKIPTYRESVLKSGLDPSGYANTAQFNEFSLAHNYYMPGHGVLLHVRDTSCHAIIGHDEIPELIEFLTDFLKTGKILPKAPDGPEKTLPIEAKNPCADCKWDGHQHGSIGDTWPCASCRTDLVSCRTENWEAKDEA